MINNLQFPMDEPPEPPIPQLDLTDETGLKYLDFSEFNGPAGPKWQERGCITTPTDKGGEWIFFAGQKSTLTHCILQVTGTAPYQIYLTPADNPTLRTCIAGEWSEAVRIISFPSWVQIELIRIKIVVSPPGLLTKFFHLQGESAITISFLGFPFPCEPPEFQIDPDHLHYVVPPKTLNLSPELYLSYFKQQLLFLQTLKLLADSLSNYIRNCAHHDLKRTMNQIPLPEANSRDEFSRVFKLGLAIELDNLLSQQMQTIIATKRHIGVVDVPEQTKKPPPDTTNASLYGATTGATTMGVIGYMGASGTALAVVSSTATLAAAGLVAGMVFPIIALAALSPLLHMADQIADRMFDVQEQQRVCLVEFLEFIKTPNFATQLLARIAKLLQETNLYELLVPETKDDCFIQCPAFEEPWTCTALGYTIEAGVTYYSMEITEHMEDEQFTVKFRFRKAYQLYCLLAERYPNKYDILALFPSREIFSLVLTENRYAELAQRRCVSLKEFFTKLQKDELLQTCSELWAFFRETEDLPDHDSLSLEQGTSL